MQVEMFQTLCINVGENASMIDHFRVIYLRLWDPCMAFVVLLNFISLIKNIYMYLKIFILNWNLTQIDIFSAKISMWKAPYPFPLNW